MHSERKATILSVLFFIFLAGGFMAACARAGTMPETFTFTFGGEYVLSKTAELVTISYQPSWGDAQRPPDAGFAAVQEHTVQIPTAEAQAIWAQVTALDPRPYQRPADTDFEPTPPNMRHTESLNWIVNGKTVAAWTQGYKFLKPDLRRPLAQITDQIQAAYAKAVKK